ncbi:MAG: hypothetical protein PHN56_05380 [Candidatus Nanoarchaeia archaeon]|nr:hypothetical protein [Candidatus Nanoarchaeia archaeon]
MKKLIFILILIFIVALLIDEGITGFVSLKSGNEIIAENETIENSTIINYLSQKSSIEELLKK